MLKNLYTIALISIIAFALVSCGDDEELKTADFRAVVHDFVSDGPVPGRVVWVLDNETGEKLTGFDSQTSDETGWVYFNGLPEGQVGFLVDKKEGEAVDTYQFNIDASAQDEKLWTVDKTTYDVAPAGAEVTLDNSKGVAAGAVYWVNASDEEEIVGCSTVQTSNQTGDVRYFGDSRLPFPLSQVGSINPGNGYFLAGNIETGRVSVDAYMGDQKLGSTSFIAFPNSICIGNIYAETDSNPMPGDCE